MWKKVEPARWRVSVPVILTLDDGTRYPTDTRSVPWRDETGEWVILVQGRAEAYPLTRLERV